MAVLIRSPIFRGNSESSLKIDSDSLAASSGIALTGCPALLIPMAAAAGFSHRANMHQREVTMESIRPMKIESSTSTSTTTSTIAYEAVLTVESDPRLLAGKKASGEIELERCNQACCANIIRQKENTQCPKS